MSREKVSFPVDETVIVELEYDDGQLSAGHFGDQWQYTLASNKIMWVEPIVRNKIIASGARRGDQIGITKREGRSGNRRSINWEVQLVQEEPEQAAASNLTPTPVTAMPSPAAPQSTSAGRNESNSAKSNDMRTRGMEDPMVRSLVKAVEAAMVAEQYGRDHGYPVRFSADEITRIALSEYISAARGERRVA
jgi:hypothetical protein